MAVATASYPGVTAVKELKYTQSLGVYPDAIALEIVPQGASVATNGTVTIGYTGQTSLTLPNCSIDSALTTYNTEGFVTSIVLRDRRELWKHKAPISGRYNIVRNGSRLTATEKTLRELIQLLLVALGEATPDVSAVDNSIYPEINWFCEEPRLMLASLLNEWGYDLALGFGSEDVVVHEIGTGTALPTDAVMMQSSGVDATIQPNLIRVCFGKSVMQARLELEAVALDTDDTYDLLNDVSYKPTAWEDVDPLRLVKVQETQTEDAYLRALASVYRVYRVKQFSDGDLVIPDGSATTLNSITQILPLENRLLETEVTESGGTQRAKAKVYGVARLTEGATGQPRTVIDSETDKPIDVDWALDGERGLVIFTEPMFKVVSGEYKPADLFLECSFSIRDNTNNQYAGYEKDVVFDASGTGVSPVKWLTERGETVVAYTAGHAADIGNNTENSAALDAIASAVATAVSGKFTASASQMIMYQYPRLSLRLDGLRQQIQHIISDGEDEPGSYTIASAGMEFDRFTSSRHDRIIRAHSLDGVSAQSARLVFNKQKDEAND